jgi:alpha-L-fucosidase
MAYSYGYSRTETLSDYKSGRELVLMLVDMVSRGGNLLLDIGPAADGRIPVIMEERLIQMGDWLDVNGEAIYSSWPWRETIQWTEGKMPEVGYDKQYKAKYDIKELTGKPAGGKAVIDAFFTCKGDTLYAITPRWPKERFVVKEVSTSVNTAVSLLGHDKPLKWKANDGDVVIDVPLLSPDELPCEYAYVFKITEVE